MAHHRPRKVVDVFAALLLKARRLTERSHRDETRDGLIEVLEDRRARVGVDALDLARGLAVDLLQPEVHEQHRKDPDEKRREDSNDHGKRRQQIQNRAGHANEVIGDVPVDSLKVRREPVDDATHRGLVEKADGGLEQPPQHLLVQFSCGAQANDLDDDRAHRCERDDGETRNRVDRQKVRDDLVLRPAGVVADHEAEVMHSPPRHPPVAEHSYEVVEDVQGDHDYDQHLPDLLDVIGKHGLVHRSLRALFHLHELA